MKCCWGEDDINIKIIISNISNGDVDLITIWMDSDSERRCWDEMLLRWKWHQHDQNDNQSHLEWWCRSDNDLNGCWSCEQRLRWNIVEVKMRFISKQFWWTLLLKRNVDVKIMMTKTTTDGVFILRWILEVRGNDDISTRIRVWGDYD